MILEFKQCLIDQNIVSYVFWFWVKIITTYHKKLSELIAIYVIFSKQTISEKLKICIKAKHLRI